MNDFLYTIHLNIYKEIIQHQLLNNFFKNRDIQEKTLKVRVHKTSLKQGNVPLSLWLKDHPEDGR